MKIGDFVIIKESHQTGEISKVLSNTKIEIILNNGFTFKLPISSVELTDYPLKLTSSTKKPTIKMPPYKVDLHIEELVSDFKYLSNSEKVQIQMDEFETSLSAAIASGMFEITFIHGIGQGILRKEIHKVLKSSKEIKSYGDAQFDRGATIVKIY